MMGPIIAGPSMVHRSFQIQELGWVRDFILQLIAAGCPPFTI